MITKWDDLPIMLNANEVQEVLSGSGTISRDKVLEVMHSKGFPLFDYSKELKVSKDALKEWLMNLGGRNEQFFR